MNSKNEAIEVSTKFVEVLDAVLTQNYVGAALGTIDILRPIAFKRSAERSGIWWKAVLQGKGHWEGKTPEEIQGLITAKIEESPEVKEVIWASARATFESISDRAAEIIGSLTAERLRGGDIPNSVFRGAIRVFAELSTEEIGVLGKIVSLGSEQSEQSEATVTLIPTDRGSISIQNSKFESGTLGERDDVYRLCRLIRTNDLCGEVFVFNGGPSALRFDRATLELLRRHLT